jgi:hypothetical protein
MLSEKRESMGSKPSAVKSCLLEYGAVGPLPAVTESRNS